MRITITEHKSCPVHQKLEMLRFDLSIRKKVTCRLGNETLVVIYVAATSAAGNIFVAITATRRRVIVRSACMGGIKTRLAKQLPLLPLTYRYGLIWMCWPREKQSTLSPSQASTTWFHTFPPPNTTVIIVRSHRGRFAAEKLFFKSSPAASLGRQGCLGGKR